jgi:hypothetical protein
LNTYLNLFEKTEIKDFPLKGQIPRLLLGPGLKTQGPGRGAEKKSAGTFDRPPV